MSRQAMCRLFVMCVLILTCSRTSAQDVRSRLEKVLRSYKIPADSLGLTVVDLDGNRGKSLFALNDDKKMIPASITKLATASAVLQRLGSNYKFQTTLWTAAEIREGVLKGDLILKGGGDPGFVSETMWFLVNELMRAGVQRVEGNIVVDDSDFDSVRTDTSRDHVRVDRAYDAPIGAMSFNWNSLSIFIRPTQIGQPPQVYIDPIADGLKIENSAQTVSKGGHTLEVNKVGNKIRVRGTIGINQTEVPVYKNIEDPIEWSGNNLVFFLKQRGVTVSGKVKSGKKSVEARLLAKADSKPLAQQVADMNKFSNNYVAEMLTKDLGFQAGAQPATLEDGMKVIRTHLTDIGLDSKDFTLVNPSGLSHRNRMRSRDLAHILVKAYMNFPTYPEMLSSLPLAGADGTLKSRMKNTAGERWVRGKTGSIDGVVGLAGYAGRKDGSVRAFAFIFNGKDNQSDLARRLFDALAVELVQ